MLDEQPVAAGEQRERRALHKRRGAEQRTGNPRRARPKTAGALVAAECDGEAEHRRRIPRGEAADQRLGLRQRRLCVLDGVVDARLEGGGDGGLGFDVDVPARDDRSGVARSPSCPAASPRGDAALVDGRRAGDDAVGGHHVADAQHEDVAHREIEEDAAAAGDVDGERLETIEPGGRPTASSANTLTRSISVTSAPTDAASTTSPCARAPAIAIAIISSTLGDRRRTARYASWNNANSARRSPDPAQTPPCGT